jgi:hypothetical protein
LATRAVSVDVPAVLGGIVALVCSAPRPRTQRRIRHHNFLRDGLLDRRGLQTRRANSNAVRDVAWQWLRKAPARARMRDGGACHQRVCLHPPVTRGNKRLRRGCVARLCSRRGTRRICGAGLEFFSMVATNAFTIARRIRRRDSNSAKRASDITELHLGKRLRRRGGRAPVCLRIPLALAMRQFEKKNRTGARLARASPRGVLARQSLHSRRRCVATLAPRPELQVCTRSKSHYTHAPRSCHLLGIRFWALVAKPAHGTGRTSNEHAALGHARRRLEGTAS